MYKLTLLERYYIFHIFPIKKDFLTLKIKLERYCLNSKFLGYSKLVPIAIEVWFSDIIWHILQLLIILRLSNYS